MGGRAQGEEEEEEEEEEDLIVVVDVVPGRERRRRISGCQAHHHCSTLRPLATKPRKRVLPFPSISLYVPHGDGRTDGRTDGRACMQQWRRAAGGGRRGRGKRSEWGVMWSGGGGGLDLCGSGIE